jgi:malonyl-CoA/methylmalonyl-CoA synthetase
VIDIRGPNVFKGYWRMQDKTKEEFRRDGFFISGDLGYIDQKGYVYISGRAKDLVISGGYNVYPVEVEAAIEAVPGRCRMRRHRRSTRRLWRGRRGDRRSEAELSTG